MMKPWSENDDDYTVLEIIEKFRKCYFVWSFEVNENK